MDIEEALLADSIGNYYGTIAIVKTDRKYYWGIGNWDGYIFKEISETLYKTLKEEWTFYKSDKWDLEDIEKDMKY